MFIMKNSKPYLFHNVALFCLVEYLVVFHFICHRHLRLLRFLTSSVSQIFLFSSNYGSIMKNKLDMYTLTPTHAGKQILKKITRVIYTFTIEVRPCYYALVGARLA